MLEEGQTVKFSNGQTGVVTEVTEQGARVKIMRNKKKVEKEQEEISAEMKGTIFISSNSEVKIIKQKG
jgi:preprotein translocase subunit YajC